MAIKSPSELAAFYEAGNIFARYYSLEDLPDEEYLIDKELTSLEVEGRGYYRRRKERIRTAISFILLTIGLLFQIAGLHNVTI